MMFTPRLSSTAAATLLLILMAGCGPANQMLATPSASTHATRALKGNTCQPDFTLGVSPTSATITTGQTVPVAVTLTSLCGLAGSIHVGVSSISPPPTSKCEKVKGQWVCTSNGPTIQQSRYDIPLDANGSAEVTITFGATPNTLKTTYAITIAGKDVSGGCCYGLTHTATFMLTVD